MGQTPSPSRRLAGEGLGAVYEILGISAISGDGAELARQEVIRRPRSTDRHFAVLELLGSGAVAVLILLHALCIDQVGDVDQHPLGSDLLAANFFFQRVKQLVDLYRQRP